MAMPRMRTAEKALEEIKRGDPDTEITLHFIRAMIREEAVPVTVCGRKKLVNLDALMELIGSGYVLPEQPQAPARGGIRPVEVM